MANLFLDSFDKYANTTDLASNGYNHTDGFTTSQGRFGGGGMARFGPREECHSGADA